MTSTVLAHVADELYLAQLAATWFMVGLIWCVQVVHYPLFERVGAPTYPGYQRAHMKRVSWVVLPVMLVELGTAVSAVWMRPKAVSASTVTWGLALLTAIWLSTFLLQVPAHDKLTRGFDSSAHRQLVRGNWARTIGWSARALVVSAPLATILR